MHGASDHQVVSERARALSKLEQPWLSEWADLKEAALRLPPELRKAVAVQLLPDADTTPLVAHLLIDALKSASWSTGDLMALLDTCHEQGVWPWQADGLWLPSGAAQGLGALWQAIAKHESSDDFQGLLLRFLDCSLRRLMQPDAKALRRAVQATRRHPAVLQYLLDHLADEAARPTSALR